MAAKLLASAVSCRTCVDANVLMCVCVPLSLSLTQRKQRSIMDGGVGGFEFQCCLLKGVNQTDYCAYSPQCNTLLPLTAALNPVTENYLTLLCLCELGGIHDSKRTISIQMHK